MRRAEAGAPRRGLEGCLGPGPPRSIDCAAVPQDWLLEAKRKVEADRKLVRDTSLLSQVASLLANLVVLVLG